MKVTPFTVYEEWNPFREILKAMKFKCARFLTGPVVGVRDGLIHAGERGCDKRGKGYRTACGQTYNSLDEFTLPDITYKNQCPDCAKKRGWE